MFFQNKIVINYLLSSREEWKNLSTKEEGGLIFWAELDLNFPDNKDLGNYEASRIISDLRIVERQ